jgi:hypothetical protein
MAAHHGLVLVSVLAALLGAAACSETPTGPATPTSRSYAPLDVRCWIEGTLLCSVNRFRDGDLTDKAEWFATGPPRAAGRFPRYLHDRAALPDEQAVVVSILSSWNEL